MRVIVGHTSADFDCLAAMIAAKKIYEDALAVFPGAIEENVRRFLLLYENALGISSLKAIDLEEITELIIVDTRQKDRIGQFASILNKENLSVVIYDHHPSTDNDIVSDKAKIEKVGAATTILLKNIIKKNISITPLESTLFALGIYEDTGSLSFPTTTKDDIDVLSYLFSVGVDLRTVNKFTNIGLNLKQKKLLNQLISDSQELFLKGINVVFASSSVKEYIDGLALITHRLVEIFNSDIIFVLVNMKNKIYVVARSNRNAVNVGEILKVLGGGGHSQAASAVVRNLSLLETENKIKYELEKNIRLETLAKDIMTTPVKTLNINTTIEEANKIMLRYGHNGFPVTSDGKLVGIITRQEIYKAKHHHYENETVDVYMSEDIIGVNPETPILEIQELMIKYDVGRVLILSDNGGNGKLEGIVTRTDLIRSLHGEEALRKETYSLFEKDREYYQYSREKIKFMIYQYFDKEILSTLLQIGKMGDRFGYSVFMVGGIVRDLFLGIPNLDLDIVIEEDAIKFAHFFCQQENGKIKTHQKFKTAVVILPNGIKIDFASARREFYEFPAALPEVEFASIKKDLYRRDFTINAMAIQLNQEKFGKLLDFYGGQRDLEQKRIRILYSLSFIEDPARIIRAVRFEKRYNFTIENSTKKLLKKAVREGLISRIRKKRLSEEFLIILQEKCPVKILKRMDELGILSTIIPNLSLPPILINRFIEVEKFIKYWYQKFPQENINKSILYLFYLLQFSQLDLRDLNKKIELSKYINTVLGCIKDCKEDTINLLRQEFLAPSSIYYHLHDKPNELLMIVLLEKCKDTLVSKRIERYLTEYKKTTIFLSGKDLTDLGMKPGPIYAKILKLILYLQMNGILNDRTKQLAFLKRLLVKGII
jgi:tRNA nucleotidyltransferase (CCA-adding enzyme)